MLCWRDERLRIGVELDETGIETIEALSECSWKILTKRVKLEGRSCRTAKREKSRVNRTSTEGHAVRVEECCRRDRMFKLDADLERIVA